MRQEPDQYVSDTTTPRLIGWVSKRGNIYTDYLEYAFAPSGNIYRWHFPKVKITKAWPSNMFAIRTGRSITLTLPADAEMSISKALVDYV